MVSGLDEICFADLRVSKHFMLCACTTGYQSFSERDLEELEPRVLPNFASKDSVVLRNPEDNSSNIFSLVWHPNAL